MTDEMNTDGPTIALPAAVVAAPGWFGKLALLGDFASRRLPPEFVSACDAWLSGGVAASQKQLGEGWLNAYLTGPLWRFAWAPGVVGSPWWFGVLMPSVDNVGRYFPLLVAKSCRHAPHDGADLDALERWYSQVAQAALGTLHSGATLERFELDLLSAIRLADQPARHGPPEPTQWTNRIGYRLADQLPLRESMNSLAQQEMMQRLLGCSLWWPQRAHEVESRVTVANGLPAAEAFADLLQGQW